MHNDVKNGDGVIFFGAGENLNSIEKENFNVIFLSFKNLDRFFFLEKSVLKGGFSYLLRRNILFFSIFLFMLQINPV